jgi:hypothetical protein
MGKDDGIEASNLDDDQDLLLVAQIAVQVRRLLERPGISDEQKVEAEQRIRDLIAKEVDAWENAPYGVDSLDESCRSAERLFYRIEKQHGIAKAQKIFAALGSLSWRRRLHRERLLKFYKYARAINGWRMEKVAAKVAENSAKPFFGLSRHFRPDSLRTRLNRLVRARKK